MAKSCASSFIVTVSFCYIKPTASSLKPKVPKANSSHPCIPHNYKFDIGMDRAGGHFAGVPPWVRWKPKPFAKLLPLGVTVVAGISAGKI